jgi:hypothetical protein
VDKDGNVVMITQQNAYWQDEAGIEHGYDYRTRKITQSHELVFATGEERDELIAKRKAIIARIAELETSKPVKETKVKYLGRTRSKPVIEGKTAKWCRR